MRYAVLVLMFLFALLNTGFANSNWQKHLEVIAPSVSIADKIEREVNPFYKTNKASMIMDNKSMRLKVSVPLRGSWF